MITIKQHQIFEAEIVRQCAPTLAGIKIANLFTYTFSCNEECFNAISSVRKILSDKSIYIELLKYNIISHRALLLVTEKTAFRKHYVITKHKIFLENKALSRLLLTKK